MFCYDFCKTSRVNTFNPWTIDYLKKVTFNLEKRKRVCIRRAMDIPMMDSYLESVAGYVRDEDKLVTYKWLSKELEVHVNIAKTILWRYWEKYKNDEESLVATFMLIGNLKSGGMRVEVVKDSDISNAKKKFENVISEHIYSLQKTLPDIELLAGSGKGDSRYSAITCEKSVILSDDELLKMRWGKKVPQSAVTEQTTSTEKKIVPDVSSKNETPVVKDSAKENDRSNGTGSKSEEKVAKKISPPSKHKNEKKGAIPKKSVQTQKAGFGHLFGKVGNQQKNQTFSSDKRTDDNVRKNSESSPEITETKKATEKLNGKINAKIDEKNSKGLKKNSVSPSPEREISSKDDSASKKTEKNGIDKKSNAKKNKKTPRGTKRERSRDLEDDAKKRKRIVVAVDSSEESAAASEEDEADIFESSPPRNVQKIEKSPSPPTVQRIGNKRKIRKTVDKTFTDEDGFLITKKVQVYESCSDEEPAVTEPKKQTEPEKPKEIKNNVRKKQTTLMSFFKKG